MKHTNRPDTPYCRAMDEITMPEACQNQIRAALADRSRRQHPSSHRRWVPAAAAIVLAISVCACAAATLSGIDQGLLNFIGAQPEEIPLLSPAASTPELVIAHNDCTLEVRQVLADRYTALVQIDFTAPKGAVLDSDHYTFGNAQGQDICSVVSSQGKWSNSRSYGWHLLEDENPADNKISLLFRMNVRPFSYIGLPPSDLSSTSLHFRLDQLREGKLGGRMDQYTVLYKGAWGFNLDLPDTDPGIYYTLPQAQSVTDPDGREVRITQVYLSPLGAALELYRDNIPRKEYNMRDILQSEVTLNTASGRSIPMEKIQHGGAEWENKNAEIGTMKEDILFQTAEILDPAEIVSLTLFGQTIELG